jgi:hypothetical protein
MSGRTLGIVGRALAFSIVASLGACANESTALTVSTPDQMQFALEVYPVLLRDCGFQACHGSTDRFLQVFGPGRGRIALEIKPLDPVVPLEIEHSYDRARSMIDANRLDQSLLLRKPLATKAGGSGHEGADELGRNVYQSAIEPGYAAISRWVLGQASGTVPGGTMPGGTVPGGTVPGGTAPGGTGQR